MSLRPTILNGGILDTFSFLNEPSHLPSLPFELYFAEVSVIWHHLFVEDPDKTMAMAESIHRAMFAFLAVSKDLDAAAFSRIDQDTGGVHYFFSPAAERVAKKYGAMPCEDPSMQEAGGLLFGDQTVIKRLYG